MPVSSTPSKRVALAPINVNVASPLQNFKNRHSHASNSLPLTPINTPKIGLVKSMSSLAPTSVRGSGAPAVKARKLESFSEYKITHSRNVKADLAATKLKLRLQLAFYKLKSKRDAALACSPNIRVTKKSPLSQTSLSPRPQSFSRSANVNLQKPRVSLAGPRLSEVASAKTANAAKTTESEMKLYHIKPSSVFYNSYSQRLPLTSANTQRLPPVHKILRTPIKAASRALSQLGNSQPISNSDETIDETADETCGGDALKRKSDILGSSPLRQNSFGTPNSFSVAKSLLQLGSGFY